MLDFETICRLCLTEAGTIRIFHNEDSTNYLDEKIMFCGRIKTLESDGLPQQICKNCATKLDTSYYFRMQIESSDHRLRELQKELEDKKSPVENASIKLAHEIETQTEDKLTHQNPIPLAKIENASQLTDTPCSYLKSTQGDDLKINIPEEVQVRESRDEIVSSNGKKQYQCDSCGKVCLKKSQLTVHIRTHTGEKPFNCSMCDKAFNARHHLTSHSRIHTAEKPFQCLYCGKYFSEKSSLSTHTKIHTNDRKFDCSHCEMKFIRPADLKKHYVKHTGEKPFCCVICNKRYSDMSNFSKHNKMHKNAQKEK